MNRPVDALPNLPRKGSATKRRNMDFLTMRWYSSRLASMGPAEILWRAGSAALLPFDWAICKKKPEVPVAGWTPSNIASYPVKLHAGGAPMGHIRVFDLEFPLGFEFDWHRDYCHGQQVERRFAGALNIRDAAVVGDLKYVWEPNRHQYLSALAFAANAEEHIGYIVRSLDSWLDANPYLYGVNWTSSLELAERILSWALLYPRIAEPCRAQQGYSRALARFNLSAPGTYSP